MILTTLATAAPKAELGDGPALLFVAGGFAAIFGFLFLLVGIVLLVVDKWHLETRRGKIRRAAGLITGAALFVASSLLCGSSQAINAEYYASVSTWLDESYGIGVTGDSLIHLLSGESVATEFQGEPTVIGLVRTVDGTFAVVDAGLNILHTVD